MSVFVSCGEASGDMYLGELTERLLERGIRVFGMGGPRVLGAGAQVLWDMRELQVVGFTEALGALPRLIRLRDALVRHVMESRPRCVVLTDSPDFHLPLARKLRSVGYRGSIVSLVPPAVWIWRRGRVRVLRELFDLCLPLFPFEHRFLLENGCRSFFVGHPLLETVEAVDMPDLSGGVVAFMPGSRPGELRRHLMPFAEAAVGLREMGYRPVFSVPGSMPEADAVWARGVLEGMSLPWSSERGVDLMGRSCFVVMASGTVSLEAMLVGRPGVVAYRTGFITMLLARLLVRSRWCSLPNILLGREVYPELLQGDVSGEGLLRVLLPLLKGLLEGGWSRWAQAFLEGRKALGERGAFGLWADLVAERAA
ncbi:lipid-A-disaccharide synthase [Thermanaerovibrio velox DSM 12556]|uniref:Lipid-A-disaccharide synthase n=1 Tax=Thermanaerovibrio velox DSM 12556 TaxID=926567 RepID=H0UQ11_9BACT|nr:lipid-A-disaccharide synthase [Thermanaerovibrio velox]EHM09640.1 lipid-A-disaccharide synthase [Thermanaerovibrio velox DSM 12556]